MLPSELPLRTPPYAGTAAHVGSQASRRDLLMLLDAAGNMVHVAPTTAWATGYEPEQLLGHSIAEFIHPEDLADVLAAFGRTIEQSAEPYATSFRVLMGDGEWELVKAEALNLLDDPQWASIVVVGRRMAEDDRGERILIAHTDIMEEIARGEMLTSCLRHLAVIIERFIPGALAACGVVDADGMVHHVASGSMPPAMLDGLNVMAEDGWWRDQVHGSFEPAFIEDLGAAPEWALRGVTHGLGIHSAWVFPIVDAPGDSVLGHVVVFHPDARAPTETESKMLTRSASVAALAVLRWAREEQLRHQALHDPLTTLPNRTLMLDLIERALKRAQRRDGRVAVLFLDVDRFKLVNDSLGHAIGDSVLVQLARRLSSATRGADTVGRFGGDEFVVLCEDVDGSEGATAAASRLLEALSMPLEVGERHMVMTASIGVAVTDPADDLSAANAAETLIRNADAAMYQAKRQGGGAHAIYEMRLHEQATRRLETESELRQGIARGELALHYQPQFDLRDLSVVGFEALVRWERPGHGLIMPVDFIDVCEDSGLIHELGRWVLDEACAEAARWRGLPGGEDLLLSVNLSSRQLTAPRLDRVVSAALEHSGLPASALRLEVTESALVSDLDAAAEAVRQVYALGVAFSIDDFGTGYATLDFVRRFSEASELKIDMSFVAAMHDHDPSSRAIVSASIALAHALGLNVTAEGVETPEQLADLRQMGCDTGQGYLLGRPVPAAEVWDLIRRS